MPVFTTHKDLGVEVGGPCLANALVQRDFEHVERVLDCGQREVACAYT